MMIDTPPYDVRVEPWLRRAVRHGQTYFYLRDLASNAAWSPGWGPLRGQPEHLTWRDGEEVQEVIRLDDEVETRRRTAQVASSTVTVTVTELKVTNRSTRSRRIEVTSYAELTLREVDAFEAHPAFAKLFVQTEKVEGQPLLLAWRRLRSPDETPFWVAHFADGPVDAWETDRLRFLGRGRGLADPQVLDPGAGLSGTVGNVLDPITSMRRMVELAPGETTTMGFGWAAAESRADTEALAARYGNADAIRDACTLPNGTSMITMDVPDGEAPFRPATGEASDVPATFTEPLRMDNGYGGFSADGSEYVLHLLPDDRGRLRLPPLPWVNVIANEQVGCIVSERGSQHTWAVNSREHRLTPWYNDPVRDPTGEALYIRDDDAGVFWTPTPGPIPQAAPYEVRHGWGYTTYRHTSHDLDQETTVFVPKDAPAKITLLRLTNRSEEPRRLTLASYARLVLGDRCEHTRPHVQTERVENLLLVTNPEADEFGHRVAFAATSLDDVRLTTDARAFLGDGGVASPRMLRSDLAFDESSSPEVPCFACRAPVELGPGETVEVTFVLGEAGSRAAALEEAQRFRGVAATRASLDAVRAWWREAITSVQIETPSPELDLMVNGWLVYQTLSCRLMGRTAYYQSGGAYGFRDQLQDAAALVYGAPERTRRQILLHAAHQFAEGDVLHWWHPPASKGIRTRFADDLLWLSYVTSFYVDTTGDASVLDEQVRFLTAVQLDDGEDERFVWPEESGTHGSVYEHNCRALDRSLTKGVHGLPLMGTGDWNDGMNRVGRQGNGESVWLGFFLVAILKRWIPLCARRGDTGRGDRYRTYLADLEVALNDAGWDGAWYRRAFYDDGTPIGSAANDECRIDAIAQAWAVLSGVASPERAQQALDAMERHLVDEKHGIIRLLTPAFDRTPHDPGYIKGYVPGVRENGGQYTHGALWAVRALAEAGRCGQAASLLTMLSPVRHTRTREATDRYKTEPYVAAADVYGVEPHVGRGGWTWYTGSAGWMWRVAVESVCGMTVEDGDTLVLQPCIPPEWDGFRMTYRLPGEGGIYEIHVTRSAEQEAWLDGEEMLVERGGARFPLHRDGQHHRVELKLPR